MPLEDRAHERRRLVTGGVGVSVSDGATVDVGVRVDVEVGTGVSAGCQSGKSAELTARELGISVFQLYDWNRTGQPARGPARLFLPM